MAKYKQILEYAQALAKEGEQLLAGFARGKPAKARRQFSMQYHHWYEKAASFLGEFSPHAKEDFVHLYKGLSRGSIRQNPPIALALDDLNSQAVRASIERKMSSQIGILQAVPKMLDVRAFSLRQILSADLFVDELSASRGLLEAGHARAAGAVAGVVLERHLKLMCERRGIVLGEKETIGSLNGRLQERYSDPSEYRRVQWLSELRVQCGHVKEVEPTVEKVEEFVEGVSKFISTTA